MTWPLNPTSRRWRPDCLNHIKETASWARLAVVAVLVSCLAAAAWGGYPRPQPRSGKVLIVRGLMTVFSLGLDGLAMKLRDRGLDVTVVPASLAPAWIENMKANYRHYPGYRPFVLIGHSLGAYAAPDLARQLQSANIPVDLLVPIDSTHENTIPANVRRCVNVYQACEHGFLEGLPMRAESKSTVMVNLEVNDYQRRNRRMIRDYTDVDHFNIEATPWVHDIVIREVLNVCPVRQVARRPQRMR